jgi:tellurium resistance protein TerD
MGAGASAADVSHGIESLGPAYAPYSLQASNNGLDGDLCQSLVDIPEDIDETLDLLNVNVKLHRSKLKNELNKAFSNHPPLASPVHAQPQVQPSSYATATATATPITPARRRSSFAVGTMKIALTWDGNVDLDLNAVSFTAQGHTLDLIYYGNHETKDRSISHSGDNQGSSSYCVEEITVRTNQLHPQAAAVVLFVRCHDHAAALSAASNVMVTVNTTTAPPTVFPLSHHADAGAVGVFRLYKTPDDMWTEDVFDLPVNETDILKILPVLQLSLRDVFDISASAAVNVVVLDKGGLVPIEDCGAVMLGLGWDQASGGTPIDLDAGLVLLNAENIYEEFVYFHNRDAPGVRHSGDNRTGEGDGDDEQIQITFNEVPTSVQSMVLAISAHEGSFMSVDNAYVRLVDVASGREIIKFELSGQFRDSSLLCCKLFRDAGHWRLFVIGEQLGGRCIVDFFFTDSYGPAAELRNKFKTLSGCHFEDARFYEVVAARFEAGSAPVRTDKEAL